MLRDSFLQLVRLGIGHTDTTEITDNVDWNGLKALAEKQGLNAVVLDGVEVCHIESVPLRQKLEWIGAVVQNETIQKEQQKTAEQIAELFHQNGIRTYVLKGAVVAECYPKPSYRLSADFDCFLLAEDGGADVWELGNQLIEKNGYQVDKNFYKNSTFHLPNLMVENHRFMVPFRGNDRLKRLEVILQDILKRDKGEDKFDGTWLYRPPVMVSALFLIEHAYSHFLHEGLTWKMVLDWMLFSKKHKEEIDWYSLDALIDEFGFRKFYDSFYRLGQYLIGELQESSLSFQDKRMLEDIWSELDLHDTVKGLKGKLALVGNTWRARWKYRYFSEISMLHALWIQAKGVLFIKEPKLS